MGRVLLLSAFLLGSSSVLAISQAADLNALKQEAIQKVDQRAKLAQEIVDSIFSFSELGFHETETQRYLTDLLSKNGFKIENNLAGIPTAWSATWGSGKPVISFVTDVDGLPNMSQKPGTAYYEPIVEGAPGHGEGHNSGMAINVIASLALKEIMERNGLSGTLQLIPGVAEEQLGAKQHFVAAGVFKDVDAVIANHVGDGMSAVSGATNTMGLISVEYTFRGVSAHGAINPWEGKSALDAVELMNVGWNFRREHLRPQQRSHYVIVDGGDQPNVVPPVATVWYYFRETDPQRVKENFEIANRIADGAALMTGTEVSRRLLGSAWPHHYNKPLGEAMDENVKAVGMPAWDEKDQQLARAVQALRGVRQTGLRTSPEPIAVLVGEPGSGPSDDIGAITWTVPTTRLRFASNIPGSGAHNWTAAIAMATPIAHKGAVAGAKVTAMTALDMLLKPELLKSARDYFDNVQTKEIKYAPYEASGDKPAIHLNKELMDKYRPQVAKYYYDPSKYGTYLEQLGINYPAIEPPKK